MLEDLTDPSARASGHSPPPFRACTYNPRRALPAVVLEEQGNVVDVTAVALSPSQACIPNSTPTAVPSITLMVRPHLVYYFFLAGEGGGWEHALGFKSARNPS